MCSDGRVRRGRTPSGWDGRRSPLLGDGWRPVRGPGGLRAALLASHHASRPAGREGDCSVVEPSLASLASVTVYFVVSQAGVVVVRDGRVVGRRGQRGGGGLDDHLSQGWRRVGPSETENIQSGPVRSSQVQVFICKALHRSPLTSQAVIKTFIKRINFKWENFMLDLFLEGICSTILTWRYYEVLY